MEQEDIYEVHQIVDKRMHEGIVIEIFSLFII